MDGDIKIKSLAKAMRLLECFSSEKPELGITEIAQDLQINKSTVYNIASTLQAMGYLSQNAETGKYSLGLRLLHFGYIINNHLGLRNFFLPYMKEVSCAIGETVYLGIPYEQEVLYIECLYTHPGTNSRNILGERAQMHCTGLGKAMLAFLPEEKRRAYAAAPLTRYTETTITDPDLLMRELAEIRRRGYSVDNMEHEYGIVCIGVPILGNNGEVVAAISIGAPSLRLDLSQIESTARRMREILEPVQFQL